MQIKSEMGSCIGEIDHLMRQLSSTTNALHFTERMIRLSAKLRMTDHSAINDPSVDENAQDPTYFIAAYFDTSNVSEALWIYRVIKSLTRYILLSDKFHETGEDRYSRLARDVRQSTMQFLRSERATSLAYSTAYWLKQFSAFWNFEKTVKRLIVTNHTFSCAEIRQYNLSKSSDAPLVYARVLDARLPSFNENVALILHYNQALLDILDDWEDIEEDVQQDMPNIFVMAAADNIPYSKLRKCKLDAMRGAVLLGTNSGKSIAKLVNDYEAAISNISLPKNFAFLKFLSHRYAETLRQYL
jgi:hypothetical protein